MYRQSIPVYIKKEDASSILRGQKLQISIIILGLAIIMGIMSYIVLPKLTGLYMDMGVEMPMVTQLIEQYFGYIVLGLIFLSMYIYSPNILDTKFEEKLSKYKPGEMIDTRNLLFSEVQAIVMVIVGLVVGMLVVGIISPIYQLTSKIG